MSIDITNSEFEIINNNVTVLEKEMGWLQSLIYKRVHSNASRNSGSNPYSVYDLKAPAFDETPTAYSDFVKKHNLSFDERVLLILALLPHLDASLLTSYISERYELDLRYKSLIGMSGVNFKGLLPTGLTFFYIMAGNDLKLKLHLQKLLSSNNILAEQKVISIEPHYKGDPGFSGKIVMAENFVELFTIGEVDKKESLKYSFNNETIEQ